MTASCISNIVLSGYACYIRCATVSAKRVGLPLTDDILVHRYNTTHWVQASSCIDCLLLINKPLVGKE